MDEHGMYFMLNIHEIQK